MKAALGILLLTGAAFSQSAPHQTLLTVKFAPAAGLAYNRLGDSTLSVITAQGTQVIKLGGVPDPHDAQSWLRLSPVRIKLNRPAGRRTVQLRIRLFVCDRQQGLCSVQEQLQPLTLTANRTQTVTLPPPRLPLP